MSLAFFRDAPWLTRRRIQDYAAILTGLYALALLWMLAGSGLLDPFGHPKGTDFVSFWTVSAALHEGAVRTVYHPAALAARESAWLGSDAYFYGWSYPPVALLIVYPLAFLPYLWSLAAWLAAGLLLYLRALWRILPLPLTLWTALAFPGLFVTLGHGQNALLTTGLLGAALGLLERRPLLAGLLLGVLTFKPQLCVLVPVALACGGHWRALAAAAMTALLLSAVTLLVFGAGLWADFLASLPFARAMLEEALVPYTKLQSVFAASRLLGVSVAMSYAVQTVATLAAAGVTGWMWRGPAPPGIKNAALVTAGLLATPFVLDYDLTLLALPIAWLAAEQRRSGARPWEKTALVAAWLLPLLARSIATAAGLPLAPAVEAALLALLAARSRPAYSPT